MRAQCIEAPDPMSSFDRATRASTK
jgi:hypothetical protein